MSRQAPAEEERNEEIEEDSSEPEQAAEEETSQQEGTEDNPVDVEREQASRQFRIIDSQRVFDHPASAGFRYRRSSGQQFWLGERRGSHLRHGRRKTGFRK